MNYKKRSTQFYRATYMFHLTHIGLTYSNVDQQAERLGLQPLNHDLLKIELKNHLYNLHERKPHHIQVAQEKHQDGRLHYHCYVRWFGQGIRVPHTFFDYQGIHPSVEQLRNPYAWRKYISKDDDPLDWIQVIDLNTDDGYDSE